ncbi:MAG: hypothetical protein RJA70_2326, partial [Pseudomonadota bacterium]
MGVTSDLKRRLPGVLRRSDLPFEGKSTAEGSEAHYHDPLYYDHAYSGRESDVAYYATLARGTGGPVLEYGVGSGRVALAIAAQGIDVTGVDSSAVMLESLRAKVNEPSRQAGAGRITLIQSDMRHLRLERHFALVIAPFNT